MAKSASPTQYIGGVVADQFFQDDDHNYWVYLEVTSEETFCRVEVHS